MRGNSTGLLKSEYTGNDEGDSSGQLRSECNDEGDSSGQLRNECNDEGDSGGQLKSECNEEGDSSGQLRSECNDYIPSRFSDTSFFIHSKMLSPYIV